MTSALALTAVLAAPACRKVVHAPAPAGQVGALARTALDHLPDDSSVLLGLSWSQVRESPLWKAVAPKLLGNAEVKDLLDHVKTVCGIDIVADFDSVVLSISADHDGAKTVALLKGKWDEDKIGNCIVGTTKDRSPEDAMTFSKEDGLSVLKSQSDTLYLAWVAPDTFAVSASDGGGKNVLAKVLHPARPMSANARLVALAQHVDTRDAVWMLAPDGRFTSVKDAESVQGVYSSLELGAAAHGYFAMRFESPQRAEVEARSGEDYLAEQRRNPSLKNYLTDSRVFVADDDVVIEARVSETKVAELAERLAKMDEGEWLLVLSSLNKLMGGT